MFLNLMAPSKSCSLPSYQPKIGVANWQSVVRQSAPITVLELHY